MSVVAPRTEMPNPRDSGSPSISILLSSTRTTHLGSRDGLAPEYSEQVAVMVQYNGLDLASRLPGPKSPHSHATKRKEDLA